MRKVRCRDVLPPNPKLSFILRARGRPWQIENSLHTLTLPYQRNVTEEDFEIVLIEDAPTDACVSEIAARSGRNVRYTAFEGEPRGSMSAIEQAYELCRAPLIAFVDSAGLMTPRLVEHALQARLLVPQPIIVVPSYDLVPPAAEQSASGARDSVLERVDWMSDGYALFESARFGRQNENGYLCGLLESEAFLATRSMCEKLRQSGAWANARTTDELYATLLSVPDFRLIVLGGEACFSQEPSDRGPSANIWTRTEREPVLFGAIPGQARELFGVSIERAAIHCAIRRETGVEEWPRDWRAPLAQPSPMTRTQTSGSQTKPLISIVLVVFRMSRQAANTIYSLTHHHQWNVKEEDYEIVVVENNSSDNLGRERACALGRSIRYFARDEAGVSPAAALNFGVARARADVVGLMIDGARMVTPRVVENVLMAVRAQPRPLVVVPGYHLGAERQFLSSQRGYDEAAEEKLLASIDWKRAGHRLFEIACFDDTTLNGFMNPLLESTCLFCPKDCFEAVGGVDERFDLPGGGIANLDLFEQLCRLEQTKLVVLWAEGAFHQYHGGTSSRNAPDRDAMLEDFRRQYETVRGHPYATWDREPQLLGSYVGPAHDLLVKAAALGRTRFCMVRDWGRTEWPND